MLDSDQRASRYLTQTGRATLTPAQRRRVNRKLRHRSVEAQNRRDSVARDRLFALAARRRRHDPLPA
ncbi:hypothetical protein [Nonomuraea sp. NPDC023979]|uniref:hypothetical protein n=1 Tax=Nonomuraea sp. NPDC023979 TaxID=3154796 RepID=UPI00340CF146